LEIEDRYFLPSGQFESESEKKGWVKIADYYPEEAKLSAYQFIDFPIDSKYENIRYIRYRCKKTWSWGGETGEWVYSMATEMWFWGKTKTMKYVETKK